MPLFVVLNSACPYQGLKTGSSFAMFSNLWTEGNETNYLLIPVNIQIFDYQKDLVEFVSSTDPQQKLATEQMLMTLFGLKRLVSSSKPFSVSYIRQGKLVEVDNRAASAEFTQPLPLLFKGLFHFRTVNKF